MNLVWATHRSWDPDAPGGAEWIDRQMLSRIPREVTRTTLLHPGFSVMPDTREMLADADRVLVTGMRFPPDELLLLAATQPVVWVHDMEFTAHPFNDFASDLILLSDWHRERQEAHIRRSEQWVGPRMHVNPGWFDTTPFFEGEFIPPEERPHEALWAHRGIWHKNLAGAGAWANENEIQMWVLMGQPRERVVEAMKQSRRFVLLSLIEDPSPLSVMEAQLAGCEPVVNDLVGMWSLDRDELREVFDNADTAFWRVVLDQ
jgi:hypothetical protein